MTAQDIYTTATALPLDDYANSKTREAYVTWVVAWKARYQALSVAIRQLKPMRKSLSDAYDADASWIKLNLRAEATRMLVARADAKAWSIMQRDAKVEADKAA